MIVLCVGPSLAESYFPIVESNTRQERLEFGAKNLLFYRGVSLQGNDQRERERKVSQVQFRAHLFETVSRMIRAIIAEIFSTILKRTSLFSIFSAK